MTVGRLLTSYFLSIILMLYLSYPMFNSFKSWLKNSLITILLVTIFLGAGTSGCTIAGNPALPSGNAITDGKALLRYALPIDNQPVRQLQVSLEDISNQCGRTSDGVPSLMT